MEKPITFAIVGDSAASGVGDSDSQGNYYGWGYHLVKGFKEPLAYINVSRPGARSKEVRFEQLPKILIHEPELVAVIVGGNDLLRNGFSPKVFEEHLSATLKEIVESGAQVMLLELHDPTVIVPMPYLVARVCRRRVSAVNHVTRKLARKYSAILLETRSLNGIYEREKWHVDRMHPSKHGHQFIAQEFAHLLRERGFHIGEVVIDPINNRNRKDSIKWMLRNGTPWFLKRSVDLLPAILILSITELIHMAKNRNAAEPADIYFPDFAQKEILAAPALNNERVS
jgi:lysophospholipase L1-like esterase